MNQHSSANPILLRIIGIDPSLIMIELKVMKNNINHAEKTKNKYRNIEIIQLTMTALSKSDVVCLKAPSRETLKSLFFSWRALFFSIRS